MDIVADIMGRMQNRLGAASCGEIRKLENEIRRDWGGEVTYVRRTDPSENNKRRHAAIRKDRKNGLTPREIAAKYRIGVATVYKIISEPD